MKVNYKKCSLGLKKIAYLGYETIWGGIKLGTKTKQDIIGIIKPNIIIEVQGIACMFQ